MKKDSIEKLRKIFLIIKPEKSWFLIIIFCSILANALVIAIPFIFGIAIDQLIEIISNNKNSSVLFKITSNYMIKYVVLIAILTLVSALISFIQEWVMASLSERITLNVRKKVSEKFKTLPMSYFDNNNVGDIITRITTNLNNLSNVLVIEINQFFSAIFLSLFGIIMLFYIDIKLSTLVIVFILGMGAITWRISNNNKKKATTNQEKLSNMSAWSEEMLSGNLVLKTFNQQDIILEKFRKINGEHKKSFISYQFLNFFIYPIIRNTSLLALIVSAVSGSYMVMSGALTIGMLQAYLQYINQISEPLSTSSFVLNAIQASVAAIESIYEILESDSEVTNNADFQTIKNPKGKVTFENVRFGYSPQKILMNKVNLHVSPGQKVAIVGPTGAGKSTLINLLMRFYEINDGVIRVDDINITKLDRGSLRSLFGMVLQNTWLFEGSVADNIAYGKRNSKRKDIIEAAKIAQCDHFIRTLPDGYDTIISTEKGSISQGEQQLLTIARLILVNPLIVILDEATSSVDTRTERLIQKAMAELTKQRTSFIIAHRLSTIVNADLILYMENGTILEKGTHSELLKHNGRYAELYNSQYK